MRCHRNSRLFNAKIIGSIKRREQILKLYELIKLIIKI